MAEVSLDINGGDNDYATIALWEADSYGATSSDDAIGEYYGIATEITAITINDTTPTSIILRPATGEENDGTPGSGYKVSVTSGNAIILGGLGIPIEIEGLEIISSADDGLDVTNNSSSTVTIKGCIIYDCSGNGIKFRASTGTFYFINNIIWDCNRGIYATGANTTAYAYNNTVYSCGDYGILRTVCVNNISLGHSSGDYLQGQTGSDKNVSSDTSAPGTTTAESKTSYSTYFEGYTTDDFHLKDTGNTLFGILGDSLSGTFTTDIDGDTRSNWDVGADEYVAAGGSSILPILMNEKRIQHTNLRR